MTCCCAAVSAPNGCRRSRWCCAARPSRIGCMKRSCCGLHTVIAPSRSERSGSGTMRSGANSMCMPKPSQAGQAPCGLLNENRRGVNSGQLVPQSGHARRSLNTSCSPSTSCTPTRPSVWARAVSMESVRREACLVVRPDDPRQYRWCGADFDQACGRVSSRAISPSMRTRKKPWRLICSSSLRYSPLR